MKIFRYSADGVGLSGTVVPYTRKSMPPYTPFHLGIGAPYPKDLYVTEEWASATLTAILRGAVAAADFYEIGLKVGFPPSRHSGLICLEGEPDRNRGPLIAKTPDCILKAS